MVMIVANYIRGSLAHGTPPNINSNYYDVPLPTLETVLRPNTGEYDKRCSECFISLCRLTEILVKVLPLIYGLRNISPRDVRQVLRNVETNLEDWEDKLPDPLKAALAGRGSVSGSRSLRLNFLSLKMLMCRVSLHVRYG